MGGEGGYSTPGPRVKLNLYADYPPFCRPSITIWSRLTRLASARWRCSQSAHVSGSRSTASHWGNRPRDWWVSGAGPGELGRGMILVNGTGNNRQTSLHLMPLTRHCLLFSNQGTVG